jgi:SAM-dependent methyltransferase
LTPEDFAHAFDVPSARLPVECVEFARRADLRYRVLQGAERDGTIVEVLKRIDADTQKIASAERRDVWERGWREALQDYCASGYSEEALVPRFIRPNQPVRLNRQYVVPSNPSFELEFVRVLRAWMFREYFAQAAEVHEFGCGTGFNLLALSEIFPDKDLYGSDFVPASVELVKAIAKVRTLHLAARMFDMTAPDPEYPLRAGAGVFTFGSLEQLGGGFEPFLQFLLERKPSVCVHVEPTVELYEENELLDYLAARFHRKRGYTEGFLPRLRELAERGVLELVKVRRFNFGSLMMEGYSLLVWKPKESG